MRWTKAAVSSLVLTTSLASAQQQSGTGRQPQGSEADDAGATTSAAQLPPIAQPAAGQKRTGVSGPADETDAPETTAQLTMSLQNGEVRSTVIAPVAEFPFADESGDGRIDLVELRDSRAAIEAHFRARLITVNETGEAPKPTYLGVHLPDQSPADGSTHLKFIVRRAFDAMPAQLEVVYDLFTRSSAPVEAWIIGPAGKQTYTLSSTERSFDYETGITEAAEPGGADSAQPERSEAPSASEGSWSTTQTGFLLGVLTVLFGLAFLAFEAGLWPFSLLGKKS